MSQAGKPGEPLRVREIVIPPGAAGIDALRQLEPRWTELAAAAVEPNVFYEPRPVLAAVRHLGEAEGMGVLAVEDGAGVLLGLLPFRRRSRWRGIPLPVIESWTHRHCYLATPLVHRDHVRPVVGKILDWLRTVERGSLWRLHLVPNEGPVYQATLQAAPADLVWSPGLQVRRPLLCPASEPRRPVRESLGGRRSRDLERRRRRLAEEGSIEVALLGEGEDPEPWLRRFLELEKSGWKGRTGSALASSPGDRDFFLEMARGSMAGSGLVLAELRVGGRTIASQVFLRSGGGLFNFKIAHDERMAVYSPGRLLDLDLLPLLGSRVPAAWVDSCMDHECRFLGRIWTHRRSVGSWLLATRRPGRPLAAVWFANLTRRLRGRTRSHAAMDGDLGI